MKIYDCFPFFNELDLLELRFRMLYDVVDYFVLVEADKTLIGNDKPYYYAENKERYASFADKIIHVKVDDMPIRTPQWRGRQGVWGNETFQRDCISRGLSRCEPEDVIIISDLDEIPKPRIIANIRRFQKIELLHKDYDRSCAISQLKFHRENHLLGFLRLHQYIPIRLLRALEHTPIALSGELFFYFLNWRVEDLWATHGPIFCKYKMLTTPNKLRGQMHWLPFIEKGYYHFSNMGGAGMVLNKVRNVADYCSRQYTEEEIAAGFEAGMDVIHQKKIDRLPLEYFEKTIQDYVSEHPNLYKA